jgi:hypothetical protein
MIFVPAERNVSVFDARIDYIHVPKPENETYYTNCILYFSSYRQVSFLYGFKTNQIRYFTLFVLNRVMGLCRPDHGLYMNPFGTSKIVNVDYSFVYSERIENSQPAERPKVFMSIVNVNERSNEEKNVYNYYNSNIEKIGNRQAKLLFIFQPDYIVLFSGSRNQKNFQNLTFVKIVFEDGGLNIIHRRNILEYRVMVHKKQHVVYILRLRYFQQHRTVKEFRKHINAGRRKQPQCRKIQDVLFFFSKDVGYTTNNKVICIY